MKLESTGGRRAPGPRGLPVIGSLLDVWKDPLDLLVQSWRTYGDVVRFRFAHQRYVFINHPDAIHHVLVENHKNYTKSRNYDGLKLFLGQGLLTSEGEFWRRQRKLAQPAFHRARMVAFAERMADATIAMLERWKRVAPRTDTIDAHAEMMRLTFQIVGQTLFSTDVDGNSAAIGKALGFALRHADEFSQSVIKLPPWVPTPENARFRQAKATLDDLVFRILDARRETTHDHGDLLSMLMAARDETTGEGMTDEQLRDEIVTIVLAGHETTANALSWTFYLLSRHPDIERKLRSEVTSVLGGRAPAFEDIPKLRYTKMILEEAMRLYPPAWAFERQAIVRDEVLGYGIPAGAVVGISPYTLHRHPKYWENPEGFDPERFAPERAETRPRYTYLPFGGGPRQCIGNGFAMMEAQIILAMVAQRFRLELVPGHAIYPEAVITLRPKFGVKVTLHPQQGAN